MSRYQKGKTNLDFTEARDSEWQWHQLGHMQASTLLQTDNHASTPPLSFLQAGCPSCRPTNSVKALKEKLPYVQCIKNRLTGENYTADYEIFSEHQPNSSRKFPVLPGAISNSGRFPGLPGAADSVASGTLMSARSWLRSGSDME